MGQRVEGCLNLSVRRVTQLGKGWFFPGYTVCPKREFHIAKILFQGSLLRGKEGWDAGR